MTQEYPIPAVRAILENKQGRFLFLKRAEDSTSGNKWCLPGGKINPGENLENTCVSELREETGLEISNLKFIFSEGSHPSEEIKYSYIIAYFTAEYKGEVKINEESLEARWIKPEEMNQYPIAFENDKVIERYLDTRESPYL